MHPRAADFRTRAHEEYAVDVEVREFEAGTKTAADAAAQIGCDVGQIASSIVMDAAGDLVVVVTSGSNRVAESAVGRAMSCDPSEVSMADPERVKSEIGWSIGGVPPLCHDADVPRLFDESLLEFEQVWAAAGTPEAVWPIDPARLVALTDATVIDVTE